MSSVTDPLDDFPTKFSFELTSRKNNKKGYRVVLILPSPGTVTVKTPEMNAPAELKFQFDGCVYGPAQITERPESELLAVPRAVDESW